ncbi:MAG: type II secretion system protein GspK [Gammaproteobacteria bacterium]|nr:general secretion pathway protein GspK [Pseudomonadales bacterium]
MSRSRRPLRPARQNGAVIIIVLWTAVLLTVLVTAMASKVRLSANTAFHNQQGVDQWAAVMEAVDKTYMELMFKEMPRPIGEVQPTDEDGEILQDEYRFNGRPLDLAYPVNKDMVVRVYDHAGKISLNRIPRRNIQAIIEKRLGGVDADPEQVQDLLEAWTDWTDLNDVEMPNGAEADYYQSLDPPYTPRNNPELETVEEILQIRGFAELFEGVNLDAAFTVYGNNRQVNLNLATREAMQMLPGLDDELIERIIAYREKKDINTRGELDEIIPFESLVELSAWVGNTTSTVYSLFVYPKLALSEAFQAQLNAAEDDGVDINPDPVVQAYMEIVETRGFNSPPRVYKVDPYAYLPDTAPARVNQYDIEY